MAESPFLDGGRDKFAAIIGPYMCRRTARDEQVSQSRQNILVLELPCNDERQAFLLASSMIVRMRN